MMGYSYLIPGIQSDKPEDRHTRTAGKWMMPV